MRSPRPLSRVTTRIIRQVTCPSALARGGTYTGALPIIDLAATTPVNQQVGVLAFLLPYMEFDALREMVTSTQNFNINLRDGSPVPGPGDQWWNYNGSNTASSARIPAFLCPSDTAIDRGKVIVARRTTGSSLLTTFSTVDDFSDGRTNYVGMAGFAGASNLEGPGNQTNVLGQLIDISRLVGIFCNRSQFATRDVLDGTSNTLAFGEGLFASGIVNPGCNEPGGQCRSACSWMGCGVMWTGQRLNAQPATGPVDGWHVKFSSRHPGMVQFALIDGSVRPLQVNMSTQAYVGIGAIKDGTLAKPE